MLIEIEYIDENRYLSVEDTIDEEGKVYKIGYYLVRRIQNREDNPGGYTFLVFARQTDDGCGWTEVAFLWTPSKNPPALFQEVKIHDIFMKILNKQKNDCTL